jgi:hypothetical protein
MMSPGITRQPTAGDRDVDAERHDVGLGVEVGCDAADPQAEIDRPDIGDVAQAAVDHDADAAFALEVGQHHLAEDATSHVAPGVDHHHVARLGVVEHMPVQLPLGLGIFVVAVQILALGHELQRQRRASDALAPGPGDRAADVRVVNPQVEQ